MQAQVGVQQPEPPQISSPGDIAISDFAGPVDTLLDRLRSKSYDIVSLSIRDVIDLICREVERIDVPTTLSTKAGWIVTAATIALLKSRLLLPAGHPDLAKAEFEAQELQQRLIVRDQIVRATDDLVQRWNTGPTSYGSGELVLKPSLRGNPGPPDKSRRRGYSTSSGNRAREIFDLLQACITVGSATRLPDQFRPQWLDLCRSSVAQRWLLSKLDQIAPETSLQDLTRDLASSDAGASSRRQGELHARAYVASMFSASLELAKAGSVSLTERDGAVLLSPPLDQNDQAARAS
ncbi:MAG: hypothetical protein ACP5RC_08970 [Halothiobacillaceae bacterium]